MWVETESPVDKPADVNKVIDLANYDLVSLGADVQRVPGRMGYADALRATLNPKSQTEPGILVCCHADTVHALGSIEHSPYRREGNKLWGPGVLGMKSGLYLCIEVLKQLKRAECESGLPVTLLLVSDKEAGCPSTRELIEATARNNKYVLVPEPVSSSGEVFTGRHAVLRFKLDVKMDAIEGLVGDIDQSVSRSAISQMAKHVLEIESMGTEDCSFTIGSMQSGLRKNFTNICTAEVISQCRTEKDVAEATRKMFAINSANPDRGLHVNRSGTLPLWEPNAASDSLSGAAFDIANDLNIELSSVVAGGGSLGNITGALGVATLDGLGARGAGLHTQAEHIEIDSLTERARLMAGLLVNLK